LEILHELGLAEEFLKLPLNKVSKVEAEIGKKRATLADFSHLKLHYPFIAFIPQWDFLNFISSKAKQYPTFHLLMETEATDVIKEDGKIIGIKAKKGSEDVEIYCELVIAADGRHSVIREKSGLAQKISGAPMDVLWFRVSRKDNDPESVFVKVDMGMLMIMLNRKDYWQCGFLIRKGEFNNVQQQGIEAFRQDLVKMVPSLKDRVTEIARWDNVKLLTVAVDHLPRWYCPGLICIGDSAHAMSPVGGIGINIAIQDAVAAANILVPELLKGKISIEYLAKIQKRRMFSVRIMQRIQIMIQKQVIDKALGKDRKLNTPFLFRLVTVFPYLQRIPGLLIGRGLRPEHVQTPEIVSKPN
jgi:2-polyprenyl-6-methoxyphenol hydroxylase-like FAD-dependent oxidoreductase